MKLRIGIAVAFAATLAAGQAVATVTTVAWYKLGEADPGAVAGGAGNALTIDSSGNGFDLTKTIDAGTGPSYSSDVSPRSVNPAINDYSTLSMQFNLNGFYSRPAPVSTATTDVGLEAWVNFASAVPNRQEWVVYNGNAGVDGYGFFQTGGGDLVFWVPKASLFFDMGAVTPNQWMHLGAVFDSAGIHVYTNGFLDTSFATSMSVAPTASFDIGISNPAFAGSHDFAGEIDNVRLFTFADGAFNTRDFLIIPEPSAALLLGVGGLWLWRRRRRP